MYRTAPSWTLLRVRRGSPPGSEVLVLAGVGLVAFSGFFAWVAVVGVGEGTTASPLCGFAFLFLFTDAARPGGGVAARQSRSYGRRRMSDESGDRWDAAQEGAELLAEGDADAAVAELERVIVADPANEYAYFFVGAAHFEKARFEKATKAYLEALRLAPGYLGALVGLGHALRMSRRLTEALKVGHQVLSRNPNDSEGLHLMGLTHFARGEAAAAKRYLERFLDSHPEVEAGQEARGLLQLLAKHLGENGDPDVN